MTCGCWTVQDGNNRVGLILQKEINSKLEIIPERYIRIYPKGEWDEDTFNWWNEYPKTFETVMKYSREINKIKLPIPFGQVMCQMKLIKSCKDDIMVKRKTEINESPVRTTL